MPSSARAGIVVLGPLLFRQPLPPMRESQYAAMSCVLFVILRLHHGHRVTLQKPYTSRERFTEGKVTTKGKGGPLPYPLCTAMYAT